MTSTMYSFRAPSTTLLRTFLKPSSLTECAYQSRQASNYMPKSKYAKVTRLDKLHRTQKATMRKEKLAALERADAISATFPQSPESSISIPESSAALPFKIVRTPSSHLPVYESAKAGGSRHVTTIRKLSGDLDSLAMQLRQLLKLPEYVVDRKGNKKTSVAINQLTKQVVIRGWRGEEVKAWMEGIGF